MRVSAHVWACVFCFVMSRRLGQPVNPRCVHASHQHIARPPLPPTRSSTHLHSPFPTARITNPHKSPHRQDGLVRMWDLYSEVPYLLGTAPSPEAAAALSAHSIGGGSGAARPVTALQFAWEQGLVITGHAGGEVRGDPCSVRSGGWWLCWFAFVVGGLSMSCWLPGWLPGWLHGWMDSLLDTRCSCTARPKRTKPTPTPTTNTTHPHPPHPPPQRSASTSSAPPPRPAPSSTSSPSAAPPTTPRSRWRSPPASSWSSRATSTPLTSRRSPTAPRSSLWWPGMRRGRSA